MGKGLMKAKRSRALCEMLTGFKLVIIFLRISGFLLLLSYKDNKSLHSLYKI